MTLRKEIGVILGLTGILINVVHLALFFFSDKPEKYHGHELVIGFGIVLALVGVMLLIDKKQER
ncbi:MAG: hypothetical protein M3367_18165 [Acidobacteriota bacterium]|nr:hypothetical protein [Acidobacteriota bacterium]